MGELPDQDYESLASRLTDPEVEVGRPIEVQSGAAAGGRELMTHAYGSWEAVEKVTLGRPKLAEAKRGPSPTVRGRVTEADLAALKKLQEATGLTQSELVREAVHQLLASHKLVS